jgi:hypothetical protein
MQGKPDDPRAIPEPPVLTRLGLSSVQRDIQDNVDLFGGYELFGPFFLRGSHCRVCS